MVLSRTLSALPQKLGRTVARRQFSSLVALDEEFPGIPSISPEPAKASSISTTTLSNGLTIVTEDASSTSTVTMTYPKAGSSAESMDEQGTALTNKCLNFMSGSGLSTLLINRTIENAGGMPFSSVDRDATTVGFTVSPENATALIPLLATDSAFELWDVRDAKAQAALESKVAYESAQMVLTENIYAAAFGPQSPAGRPIYGTTPTSDAVQAFRGRAYGLNGAVLAATGVKDHAAFCSTVTSLLADSPAGSSDSPAPTQYLGGESRVSVPASGYAHVALAFQCTAPQPVARVVAHVLNLAGKESGVASFSAPGLLGLYAGSDSPSTLVDSITKVAKATVSPDVVKRAQTLAKTEAVLEMDAGSKSLASAMTTSVLTSSNYGSAADVAKAYDAVTAKLVADALASVLQSNPALAAVGDLNGVPYQATVAANFK